MLTEDLLDAASIAPRVAAVDKRRALAVIAEIAGRAFGLKTHTVFETLLAREAVSPTGVGHGVAIPHCQVFGLNRIRGIFVRLEKPVDFGAVDEVPVDLLFALLAPPAHGSEHLRALARVSRLLRERRLREHLRQAHGADAIRALLVADARSSAA